jgi:hypothetical protein
LSNEIITYTSIELAARFYLGEEICPTLMDILNVKYEILDGRGLVAGSYAEKALSEVLGKVGVLIFKKALEYDRQL